MTLFPLHPAVVHLPIAFVVLSVVADLLAAKRQNKRLRIIAHGALVAALLGGGLAILFGYLDMNRAALAEQTREFVHIHLKIGWILASCLGILTLWRWLIQRSGARIGIGYFLAAFLVLALTLFQGWYGGEMVFSQGAGVAAAGQGAESAEQAQHRLARVKEVLSPGERATGRPGREAGTERGRDQNPPSDQH